KWHRGNGLWRSHTARLLQQSLSHSGGRRGGSGTEGKQGYSRLKGIYFREAHGTLNFFKMTGILFPLAVGHVAGGVKRCLLLQIVREQLMPHPYEYGLYRFRSSNI